MADPFFVAGMVGCAMASVVIVWLISLGREWRLRRKPPLGVVVWLLALSGVLFVLSPFATGYIVISTSRAIRLESDPAKVKALADSFEARVAVATAVALLGTICGIASAIITYCVLVRPHRRSRGDSEASGSGFGRFGDHP